MFNAVMLTVVAGLCTGLGALMIFFTQKVKLSFLALAMSFSAGIMLYISLVGLLPIALESELSFGIFNGHFIAIALFAIGAVFTAMIDYFIPTHISKDDEDTLGGNLCHCHHHSNSKNSISEIIENKSYRTGVFIALAIAIHNFPEGLAVFATASENMTMGLSIAIGIALHNIPEGLIVALPIYVATKSKTKAFIWATLSGLTEPLGAIFGYSLISSFASLEVISLLNAFVAGIMVYIALDELLPMAKEYGRGHTAIFGTFIGMLFIAFVSMILECPNC
ncbi:MAG: zinc transporter ZupT [Opitutales bacterium]